MLSAVVLKYCIVSDVDLVERFKTHFEIFRRRVGIFSLFFLLKVLVNFSSVFYRNYTAVVTSSRHRPFCFHNFVFLLNCLFVLNRATRISVCVITVSKSHEVLLQVRRLSPFFSTTTPTSSHRRVVIFSMTSDTSTAECSRIDF